MNAIPLWKRCRVLANPARLKMLACLDQNPRQYVKAVGERLGLAEDVASKNLQLLASGGFLISERKGRYLYYSVAPSDELARVVLDELLKARGNRDGIIRTLTALTHERRVVLIAALSNESLELNRLCRLTRISVPAAGRHLDKLVRRGWIKAENERYVLFAPKTPLERELVAAAKKSVTLAHV